MSTLTITRGLPASGKTTWAKAWVDADPEHRARVNRDDLRHMLYGAYSGLSWPQEEAVTQVSTGTVKTLLRAGIDVVADDMNLRPKYAREWQRFARANGAEFQVQEFEISISESCIRNGERHFRGERSVPEPAIHSMRKFLGKNDTLLPLIDDRIDDEVIDKYVPKLGAPRAIMVDIDGTVALANGRNPYDMTTVGDDLPNTPVIDAVLAAKQLGYQIVFCSGRDESCRSQTEGWLRKWISYGPVTLYMRPEGDRRKDSIVKRELFDQYIRNQFYVVYVLDDRQQVVDMWRELGLTVLQVAKGDF